MLTQKVVLWHPNTKARPWSLWEREKVGVGRGCLVGRVPTSWPERRGPKRGPPVTEPLGPHMFILSLASSTDHIESPHATTTFICTVWFWLTRSNCMPTGDSTALMVGVCQEGEFTYSFLDPVSAGGYYQSSLRTQMWKELTPPSTAHPADLGIQNTL